MQREVDGRVVITWPSRGEEPSVLSSATVAIHDADSGEQLWDAVQLGLGIGDAAGWTARPLVVTVTRVVDEGGKPATIPVPTPRYAAWLAGEQSQPFEGARYRTAQFYYAVAEMRIAQPSQWTTETGVHFEPYAG